MGPTTAVDALTFTAKPGQVTGFLGLNGAGRSTTMRLILGLEHADAGTALVSGRPYRCFDRPLQVLGSLLEAAPCILAVAPTTICCGWPGRTVSAVSR